MTTTALSTSPSHEIIGYQKWGDQIKTGVRAVLEARFAHRNADGTTYVPRIASSVVYAPWYHVITLEPQALWHFSEKSLVHEDVLNAIAGTVHRSTRYISLVPGDGGKPAQKGIAYVITLRDIPKPGTNLDAPRVLPKLALYEAHVPNGDLMVPVGKIANGEAWYPLTRLLHLLVSGESGSGKSNYLKSALLALITDATPDKLRIAIISPKRAEFAAFSNEPHQWRSETWSPAIAANADEADKLILALQQEFDRRDLLFAANGVTNLDEWNARVKPEARLPRILVMADEVLDLALMAKRGSRMMDHLASLTSKARSHGFHIFIGTTKPNFDVLPTILTSNMDNRIAFRVATADSARQMKCPGADDIMAEDKGHGIARIDGKLFHFQAFLVGDGTQPVLDPIMAHDVWVKLTDLERTLAEWANNNGGYLSLASIQKVGELGPSEARRLALDWQARGWLVKDVRARNKNKITEKIVSLLEC